MGDYRNFIGSYRYQHRQYSDHAKKEPPPMSDSNDLRTRIAAVLRSHWPGECTDTDEDESPIDHLADAVIRGLGPLVRYWDKDFKELHYCRECGGWGPMDD